MATVESEQGFDVVPTRLAVKAMRDSGYKNAAYAIAELVDNAVQAGARCVEVLCKEDDEMVRQRSRRKVQQIAVVDDGIGMNAEVLRRGLQFGNGERLNDRSGIGRVGMGLPNSSISQARRVDVWSWQSGHASAMHSYLDLDEVETGELRDVPLPESKAIPVEWLQISATMKTAKSGTLVLWSKLDRCDWKTAQAIFRNSEFTIGRIYRYFLSEGKGRIRMASFVTGQREAGDDDDVRPNDPLYLMGATATPAPWDADAMFEAYGDPFTVSYTVDGKSHTVTVRISVAKRAARSGQNAGGLLHGKHAGGNIGVSVVRARRELELQTGWCVGYDPRERWWGIEVDFPPALDTIFGVPNNKQGARALAEFAAVSLDQMALREGYASEQELREAWTEDNDPRMILVLVKHHIESNLRVIRKAIKAQEGRLDSKRKRHEDANSAESRGKSAAEQRERDGNSGGSDAPDSSTPEEKVNQITRVLEAAGLSEAEARPLGVAVVESHAKFVFFDVDLQTPEFFTVRIKAGAIIICLNTSHPAYEYLIALRSSDDDTDDVATLKLRLHQSYEGLKLLLESWARYEDELNDVRRREQAQMARLDWGRVARDFFRNE
jgi:hypothetical protein